MRRIKESVHFKMLYQKENSSFIRLNIFNKIKKIWMNVHTKSKSNYYLISYDSIIENKLECSKSLMYSKKEFLIKYNNFIK
jgi:hypothetical protein